MSVHVKVCTSCQRSIAEGADQCRYCPPVNTCLCCGAKLKQAMLRCRECGTATNNPSQRQSAQNGNSKTVAAAGVHSARTQRPPLKAAAKPKRNSAAHALDECLNCGSELRPGMLRCRDCGHSAGRISHSSVTNTNSHTENNGGRQTASTTGNDTLSKATTSQPISVKPSPTRSSPPLVTNRLPRQSFDAKSSIISSAGSDTFAEPLTGGWAGIAQTTSEAQPQEEQNCKASNSTTTKPARKKRRTKRKRPREIQSAAEIADGAVDTVSHDNHSQEEQTSAVKTPKQSFFKSTRRSSPLFVISWRSVGLIGGVIVGVLLGAVFVMRPSAGAASVPVNNSTERDAAVWVVRHYGVVTVKTATEKEHRYVAEEHLPDEPFVVTEINLYDQELDEAELSFLPHLSGLTKLDLSRTGVGEKAIGFAGAVPTLKALYLRGNQCPAELFSYLENGDQYENCSVSGSRGFDDAALAVLVKQMPNLKVLSCSSTDVSAAGLSVMATLKSLKSLTATKNNWPEEAVTELGAALPRCKIKL